MQIVESLVESKSGSHELCEDGIYIGEHFIAVIDGASTKSHKTYDGKKTGRIAMELIIEALKECPRTADADECLLFLNEAISDWYKNRDVFNEMQKNPHDRCCAGIVVFSRLKSELWFLGDCQALVGAETISPGLAVDDVTSRARALFLESELMRGKTIDDLLEHDTGREFIQPLLERQNLFQNFEGENEFRYGVLDGVGDPRNYIQIYAVPESVHEVVLASDGYPELSNTLVETELVLSKILHEDPLMFRRYKSTKGLQKGAVSYDDRAYVRFRF